VVHRTEQDTTKAISPIHEEVSVIR